MNNIKITNLTLDSRKRVMNIRTGNYGFPLNIEYVLNSGKQGYETITLPYKEAAYLWAWLDVSTPQNRTNNKWLGKLKAMKLAHLISSMKSESLIFERDITAYLFFKKHFDSSWMQILLGNDYDEVTLKLEKDANYNVLGGYLGGETESKDKTRFKTLLKKQLINKKLTSLLLPSSEKNEQGKRIQNQFSLKIVNYTIL